MLSSLSSFARPAMISPALSVMSSIINTQNEAAKSLSTSIFGIKDEAESVSDKSKLSTEALNHIYFGDHVSVTEAKIKLLSYVNRYLTDAIDVQESFEANGGKGAASTGVTAKLVADMDAGERDSLRDALPSDLSDMDSAIASATRISLSFNLDRLSADRGLVKYLEQMMGMDLGGLSAADIIKSFTDPTRKSAEKVNAVLSEGLAGQAGSKAMQRLEDAAAGPRTVAEAKQDAADKSGFEEVDSETKAEDVADVDTARVMETLGRVIDEQGTDERADTENSAAGEKLQAKLDAIRAKTTETSEATPADDVATTNEPSEAYFEFMLEAADREPESDLSANYF